MSDARCPACHGPARDCDDFEWVEVTCLGDPEPRFIPGKKRPCLHPRSQRVPVESCVTGEDVAVLCTACDAQLGAGFVSRFDPPTHTELDASVLDRFRP